MDQFPQLLRWSVLGMALALGACSSIATTTDTTSAAIKTVSDTTSSTTDVVTPEGSKSAFVHERFDALRVEAARGDGENLDSLAVLLGETDRAAFSRWMKANYVLLFSDIQKPEELLARIERYRGSRG